MKRFIVLIAILIAMVGCGSSEIATSTKGLNGAKSNISIKFKNLRKINRVSEIDKILLTIISDKLTYVSDKEFEEDGEENNWTIEIPSLPMDEDLEFTTVAKDSGGNTIYTSDNNYTLDSSENRDADNPYIVYLVLQEETQSDMYIQSIHAINMENDVNITKLRFDIHNKGLDDINYSIYSADGYSFDPNASTILGSDFDSNSPYNYILDVNYTKPTDAGTFANTFTMVNTNGDKVVTAFNIIINDTSHVDVKVNMPPVIDKIDMNVSNDDNNMTLFAHIDDYENEEISYIWRIDQDKSDAGLSFIDDENTTNPVYLEGFDMTKTYYITLEATDGNGSMSKIEYTINYQ
jgi:hypothetical protein